MRLNKFYPIMGFVVLCLICLGIWMYQIKTTSDYSTAEIVSEGKAVDAVDLSKVDEPYEIDVNSGSGYNKIRVEQGRIAVIEADCPDKVCVNQGYITNGAVPIVCLPHKLTITLKGGNNSIDAVAGN